ncbi:cyclic GMP-AMP synthase isoform X2 [Phacochoerus africanus]|uniref:cyclic GMP-AMP synthase isoform X2 n=1 Tax=Phacochoerus africanus TaxID=41426 RepID=UPI001FD90E67|nr:cyclic GMP-AMP synthase isoform X2 [Phacochoerus africanus]
MAARRGKSTRTASEVEAAGPRASARSVNGAPTVPEAARPGARRNGPSRASGCRQEKSGPDPREKPQVRTRTARAEDQAEGASAPSERVEPPSAQGLSLLRAGSRREREARSARERRPQAGPTELSAPARMEAPPGAWKLQTVLEKVRLSRHEISEAAEVVNRVVEHLLRRLQGRESEFKGVALLRTGSYYERVKISAPNEFDVMFKLEVPRIQLEEYCNSGAHYFVKFKRNPGGNPLEQFLEKEILSASKMLSKFRKIIKEEIKNIEGVTVERKRRGSPAVTLLISKPKEISVDIILALEPKSRWPASTQKGLPIKETWRLSFSHIEKDILKNHGESKTCCETDGMKCCRKECLKLMKYLLEQLKKKFGDRRELAKFCSYHVKTAFFHVCTQDPHDNQWQLKNLECCFDNCVAYFLQCLKTEQLANYFIPGVNLFSRDLIDKPSKEFLSKQIEYERNNGFPVFW